MLVYRAAPMEWQGWPTLAGAGAIPFGKGGGGDGASPVVKGGPFPAAPLAAAPPPRTLSGLPEPPPPPLGRPFLGSRAAAAA